MNVIMHAKIETCLELCTTAADFKKKVLQVTGLSSERFNDLGLTSDSFKRLEKGENKADILRDLF